MTVANGWAYLLIWSAIGCAAFCVYVVVAFRAGLVYTARNADGTLKERIPLSGILNMLALLFIIIGFQCVANYLGLARRGFSPGLLGLYALNFGHYLLLFLFDSLVIDGLVLSVWRPGFLGLPDALGRESMKKHLLISLPVGTLAGLVLAAASTLISHFVFFRV
jgi:hypothetical protein